MKVSDPAYFALKRLHSLTGVVPIGLFLVEHLYTNSRSLQGAGAFDRAVTDLAQLPFVVVIEALGIWLPILFHMVLGVLIATTAQANAGRHGYARNWHYTLQRGTGLLLVVYIVWHTFQTRFSGAYLHAADPYAYVARSLANPWVLAFYALGIVSACYHFGNGLFGFAIHWGLATGRNAQRLAGRLALAVFAALAVVGLAALLGFRGARLDWLQKPHAFERTTVVYRGAAR